MAERSDHTFVNTASGAGTPGDKGAASEEPGREGLSVNVAGFIATIDIIRPRFLNAMTTDMWAKLRDTARELGHRDDVRVTVIRGAGRAFTSGSDIGELARLGPDGAEDSFVVMVEALAAIENMPCVTIASIAGPALGAGLELALACDLRVASEEARFGMPIGRLGITVSPGFAARMVRLGGEGVAKDLLLAGRVLTAGEALRAGFAQYVTEPGGLEEATRRLAERAASMSPASVRAAKRVLADLSPRPDDTGVRFTDPHAFPEGVQAFLERRDPRF